MVAVVVGLDSTSRFTWFSGCDAIAVNTTCQSVMFYVIKFFSRRRAHCGDGEVGNDTFYIELETFLFNG